MASTTHWKLRRLARRAKRVLSRRSADSAAVAAYAGTLPGKADAYIAAYDSAAKYENVWKREMAEGRGAVAALVKAIRSWLPFLVRDVPNFDGSSFGDQPDVPDDVLDDGNRLLDSFDESTGADGNPLAYRDAATQALTPLLAAADKEWSEAEAADATYQKLLATVRATAAVLDLELQTFRRTLASELGRRDKDFQKLRVERASQKDEEDDADAPEPPAEVKPARADEEPPSTRKDR